MTAVTPSCFTRGVRRLFLCACFLVLKAHAAAPDLSGYWTLDLKRSETAIAVSKLSSGARDRVRNFDPLKHDPVSVCMPYGMPRVMSAVGALPMEIIQTDAQVTMLFDAHDEVRRIFIAKTPSDRSELAPLWLGYAYGKWEGATLVVETIGLTDQGLVDATGIPHSEKLRVVERLRRLDANTLLDEMTLEDGDAFAAPITRKFYYTKAIELQQREFHCAEQQWLDHVMGRAKELTRELAERKK